MRTDGAVECWGRNEYGELNAPEGRFTAVTAGAFHNCGLHTDGTVDCWGTDIVQAPETVRFVRP